MRSLRYAALVAGLALVSPGAVRAGTLTLYKLAPIARAGDTLGGVRIGGYLAPGTLNDKGQLVFQVQNAAGGQALMLYADGQFTPLVVGGGDAPGGKWPNDVGFAPTVSMNQSGSVAFAAPVTNGGHTSWATFRWDAQAQKFTALAVTGLPAGNNLTFEGSAPPAIPRMNNRDEIVLTAYVKGAAGPARQGVFLGGQDGKLLAVALPDQELPGGGKSILNGGSLSINDAGVAAFQVRRQGDGDAFSAYSFCWEQGTLAPLAVVGQDVPGVGKIAAVTAVRVNNKNRTVLVAAHLSATPSQAGLYRWADGALAPVVAPGQAMPGGGILWSVKEAVGLAGPTATFTMSHANEAGQHAFLAQLEDGGTALYLLEAEGKLSLIVQIGMATELGPITSIVGAASGPSSGLVTAFGGVSLNSKRQVALTATFAGGPPTLVLLTPTAAP